MSTTTAISMTFGTGVQFLTTSFIFFTIVIVVLYIVWPVKHN